MKIQIDKLLLKSLLLMVSIIEARDAYTGGHLWRVSQYSRRLAAAAGMPPDMVFLSGLGGFLHDIGKVGIPDAILGKRGNLDTSEYEIVKTHPGIGATLIQEHPLGDLALQAVHHHHEWVNGTGYPGRLQEDQISLYGRIVSIADAFDALTSTRPYRREVAAAAASEALQAEHGTQFDVRLLDAFLGLIQADGLENTVGHSDQNVPMVRCPNCGPVIVVSRSAGDGDKGCCRVCGAKHRLHRQGDTFAVESLGVNATAEERKPYPETSAIDDLVGGAPEWVNMR